MPEAEQTQKLVELQLAQSNLRLSEFQWHDWYQALSLLFPRPAFIIFTEYPFTAVVYSIVTAAAVLLGMAGSRNSKYWIACMAVFLISVLCEVVAAINYLRFDNGKYYQMAGLLRELRGRQAPPKTPPVL
jgi:hypothetical protein